ncbi:MAG: ATP-binding protein, partial [Flavobacteriales bacterium]
NEETRETKGTGLGLFIVRYLARLHGAEISISDNHPKGTVINLTFRENQKGVDR